MSKQSKSLGELLLDENKITKENLAEALQIHLQTKKKLGKVLIEKGFIDEDSLYKALEKQLGIHFLKEIEMEPVSRNFELLPFEYCKSKLIAPIELDPKTIKVYVSEPTNSTIMNEISFMTGKSIETGYATESAIRHYLNLYLHKNNKHTHARTASDDKIQVAENSPAVQFVNEVIKEAADRGASDVHLEIYQTNGVLKYRIDGILTKEREPDKDMYPALISRIKILSNLDISEKRLPQDGKINFAYGDRKIDIRVSIIPTIYGENAVLRLLDKDKSAYSLEDIGLSQGFVDTIKSELQKPHGMILMTGPTGSGKTTTLYAMLKYLIQFNKKIITIEDPVEYQIDGISQVQAHSDIGLNFAAGLRSFLRHDPDVIMVGEIRDRETAEIAIRAALTGHLVLSTVHTNHAAGAISRLIDMGIPPYLINATLNTVIAQRLLRKSCPHCHLKGCPKCRQTGYIGRTAIFELVGLTKALREAIQKEASTDTIHDIARKEGFRSMKDEVLRLIKEGKTSREEGERIVSLGDEE